MSSWWFGVSHDFSMITLILKAVVAEFRDARSTPSVPTDRKMCIRYIRYVLFEGGNLGIDSEAQCSRGDNFLERVYLVF